MKYPEPESSFLEFKRETPKNDQIVKMISNTSFQLKGTGWYVTDFKDQPKDQPNKTNKE